ncbi:hypothetical protein [Collimonas silvisoli]|uniref:hypothetical protein n=1 Tax=Collimonas silvisoli TaxID=2825884 RepID=UPI001B8D2105|nr:hypothetical protein [Collimonas silvisoli]
MNNFLNKISLSLIFIFSMSQGHANTKISNCERGEEVFYSCGTGKKIISFCASPKESSSAYLEYRFGVPKKIELSYKATEKDLSKKFNRAEMWGASNASTVIWFENNGVDYILSDPVKGDTTMEIIKNQKIISKLTCKEDFYGATAAASNFIEEKEQKEFFNLHGHE